MLTAIVGILFGNLLIATLFAPALHNLREILTKFADIKLPYRELFGAQPTAAERQQARAQAASEFSRLFREYAMAFAAFRKVGGVFVFATIILACAVAWQLSTDAKTFAYWTVLFVSIIVLVGIFLQRAIAPTPSQLISIDFLQNNFANLHMSSLLNSSSLHLNFGREDLRDPVIHFNIAQDLMFSGYRFMAAVSNRECSRVFFVAYGLVGDAVNFQQLWTPELQQFTTPLGDFSLADAMLSSPLLRLHSWLFIPTPAGWTRPKQLHPQILSQDVTDNLGGGVGIVLTPTNFGWRHVDENVDFERKSVFGLQSWKITRLTIAARESPQRILQMYQDKLVRCPGIECHDYPNGVMVKD
jgi:hypothetical protein